MSRELNKIFDVKSRQARRDILDKFDLSKDDKNKVLNKIDNSGGDSNGIKWEYYRLGEQDKNSIFTAICDTATLVHKYAKRPYITGAKNLAISDVTKIACAAVPYTFADAYGTFIVSDSGSWKENFMSHFEFDEDTFNRYLTPITKEEFFTLESTDGTITPLL